MSGHVFVLGISKSGLVFASLGLYLQVWDVFASLACICSSGLVFASLDLDLEIWVCNSL